MLTQILKYYDINKSECAIKNYGTGLINTTWKINTNDNEFILQQINNKIFTNPYLIEKNIQHIATYLKNKHPDYLFVSPIKTNNNKEMVCVNENEYYRLFRFVQQSHTIDVASNPQQAYEAAKQFGAFTKKLSKFNTSKLEITLQNFHNLSLRYQQFINALKNGKQQKIQLHTSEIDLLKSYKNIVDEFEKIKLDNNFKIRVTHHDTKISNVLFDKNNHGICVIDLDTVMPGYFISDVGDMIRTYVCPVSEDEKNFDKIKIRPNYLEAIIAGYLSEMNNELTTKEKRYFIYAGKFMIYMQALRFFTDYLNDDIYYSVKYAEHNLVRAKNQLVLLQLLM